VGAEGEKEGTRNRVRQGGRREERGGMEKATREEKQRMRYEVKIENQGRKGYHPQSMEAC
jgi:hypothetical protein